MKNVPPIILYYHPYDVALHGNKSNTIYISRPCHSFVISSLLKKCSKNKNHSSWVAIFPFFWKVAKCYKITELVVNLAWCTPALPYLICLIGTTLLKFLSAWKEQLNVKYKLVSAWVSFSAKRNFTMYVPYGLQLCIMTSLI